jgi:hypothetical protein
MSKRRQQGVVSMAMHHRLIQAAAAMLLLIAALGAPAQSPSDSVDLEQTMTVSESDGAVPGDAGAGPDSAGGADQSSEEQQGDILASEQTDASQDAEALALISALELDILGLEDNGFLGTDSLLPDDLNDVLNNATSELAEITEILSLSELLNDLSAVLDLLPIL